MVPVLHKIENSAFNMLTGKKAEDELRGVVVTGADPAKTKWMLQDKELEQNECYIFSHSDEGGNRKKLVCEIKDFDKPLAGEYKAVFYSADGENSATFTVTAGNAPDFHDKPHIVQRDNGNVIVIKVRAKSHLEMKAEWFKVRVWITALFMMF
ncbi:unnamed protein product [Strongylus vulgaris]|uniref:Immunoglobulin I-set domain-containing protein n=1 Tax=Strongylus vulgaris TaxID=40348 RepID=A0A3P7JXW1_STRVU|nr:unnamed protein product [Strongylus vulgaris]